MLVDCKLNRSPGALTHFAFIGHRYILDRREESLLCTAQFGSRCPVSGFAPARLKPPHHRDANGSVKGSCGSGFVHGAVELAAIAEFGPHIRNYPARSRT